MTFVPEDTILLLFCRVNHLMTMPIQLTIDGRTTNPPCLRFIFQREAFPGEHEYELRIATHRIDGEVLLEANFQSKEHPPEKQARDWFFWLGHLVSRIADPEECRGDTYVANNIISMTLDSTALVARGPASPWLTR